MLGVNVRAVFALVVAIATSIATPSLAQEKSHLVRPAAVAGTREELAERYFLITNRYALAFDSYKKQIRNLMTFCDQKPCKSDLDHSIEDTLSEVGPKLRERMIKIYADHLTKEQLLAAIEFAKTPIGRSIIEAENRMTDDLAMVGSETAKDVYFGVSKRFCAV